MGGNEPADIDGTEPGVQPGDSILDAVSEKRLGEVQRLLPLVQQLYQDQWKDRIETDPADPKLIVTVWGDGYKFADV